MRFEHSPILQRLQEFSVESPDKPALFVGDEMVSYGLLWSRIMAGAWSYQQQGMKRGDCLALKAERGLRFVYAYFAAHAVDASVIVIDPESSVQRRGLMLSLTKPRFALGFNHEGITSLDFADIDWDNGRMPDVVQGAISDDVADIVFTTGTTGSPKGVCLTHFNIFSSAANINGFIGNTRNETEVLGLPLCHSFGLGRLRCTMIKGATLVIVPGGFANLKAFFQAIETHHATGFGMVPAVWAYIRKFSGTRIAKYAPQLKYIEIGSAAMPSESKKELCEMFPGTRICHHYGLTEASRAVFMEYHANEDDLKTIGCETASQISIKIFDENGIELPHGESGEICVKGNMVMKGYLRPEENEQAYFGEYFRTGDEGFRAKNGKLYLVSRKKELINVGGKKVSPVEIEDAIMALGVLDCVVIGIADPNKILGEVPKAYILRNSTMMSLEAIRSALSRTLESYKIPVVWDWIDAIPQTASGKKQRLQLAKSERR